MPVRTRKENSPTKTQSPISAFALFVIHTNGCGIILRQAACAFCGGSSFFGVIYAGNAISAPGEVTADFNCCRSDVNKTLQCRRGFDSD